jgi:hypothetical protein
LSADPCPYANQFFSNALLGKKPPEMDEPKREQFQDES